MSQLHQRKRNKESLSDDYETPKELYDNLCYNYEINPQIDVCAEPNNSKCIVNFSLLINGLEKDWYNDVWCNPPHSKTKQFVMKAFEEWKKHQINIMMIIPTNTMSSGYWHNCIEKFAEYHPIKGRIRFLVDGKPSKYTSRNAYCVVIWRKNEK